MPLLPIGATGPGLSGRFSQDPKPRSGRRRRGLDGFWPGRTMPGSGAGLLPIAAKSGLAVDALDCGDCDTPRRPSWSWSSRQPTGVWARRSGSPSGSGGEAAASAARAARPGRLEDVKKVLTEARQLVPNVVICPSRSAPSRRHSHAPKPRVLARPRNGHEAIHLGKLDTRCTRCRVDLTRERPRIPALPDAIQLQPDNGAPLPAPVLHWLL